jgi:RND family efflux transporter MFP subunit
MSKPLLLLSCLALALAGCNHSASDDADSNAKVSAAVTTQAVKQGDLPDIVSAYGTAAPGIDGASTLSIHAEGSVTRFDVTAGTAVKRGQRLLTFRLSPAAASAFQQARTAWEVARTQREHTRQLLDRHLATRDQLDQADKLVSDTRSSLDALRQQQGDSATLDLTAPFDGVVSTISATQGDVLQPGAALLSLMQSRGVVISVGVEMDPAHVVKVGDHASLSPLGAGATGTGMVKRVADVLDARSHLQNVDIAPDGNVLAGMGYKADITVGRWHGWLIPREALTGDGGHWQVFQTADNKAVAVPVTILGESDTTSVVLGALDAQRPLVVVGNTQLDDGMAVRANAQAEPSK